MLCQAASSLRLFAIENMLYPAHSIPRSSNTDGVLTIFTLLSSLHVPVSREQPALAARAIVSSFRH